MFQRDIQQSCCDLLCLHLNVARQSLFVLMQWYHFYILWKYPFGGWILFQQKLKSIYNYSYIIFHHWYSIMLCKEFTKKFIIERGNKMGKIILEFIKNSMFTINIFLRMFLILLFLDAFSKFYCLQEKRKRREFCHGNIIVRDPWDQNCR